MPSIDTTRRDASANDILLALRDEVAATLKADAAQLDGAQTRTLQERGLQSLGALRIQYRIHDRLGVQASLSELLGARALDELAHQLHARLGTAEVPEIEVL